MKSRLGEEKYNNHGCLMKIIEYNNNRDIVIEFQDEYKEKVHTSYQNFSNGNVKNIAERLGEYNLNNQGCTMKIIAYYGSRNVLVEFQDEYKTRVNVEYKSFILGEVKNPYYPSICGVGVIGNKYPISINGKATKEYNAWRHMLQRCFYKKIKEKNQAYKDVTCCDEWLLFENFYEWLHCQENFHKWLNGDKWAIDKDILVKRNKIYSPNTCCLVPMNVNSLFIKGNTSKGKFPVGVQASGKKFIAQCKNPFTGKTIKLGTYNSLFEAFRAYKLYKENIIKQIAKIEFENGNITNKTYDAMINYEVEITD